MILGALLCRKVTDVKEIYCAVQPRGLMRGTTLHWQELDLKNARRLWQAAVFFLC